MSENQNDKTTQQKQKQQSDSSFHSWKIEGESQTDFNLSSNSIHGTSNIDNVLDQSTSSKRSNSSNIRYEHEEIFFNDFVKSDSRNFETNTDLSFNSIDDIESSLGSSTTSSTSIAPEERLSKRFSLSDGTNDNNDDTTNQSISEKTTKMSNLSAIEKRLFGDASSTSSSTGSSSSRRPIGFKSKQQRKQDSNNDDNDIEKKIKNMLTKPKEKSNNNNSIKRFLSFSHQPNRPKKTVQKKEKKKKKRGPSVQFNNPEDDSEYNEFNVSNYVSNNSLITIDGGRNVDDDDDTVKIDNKSKNNKIFPMIATTPSKAITDPYYDKSDSKESIDDFDNKNLYIRMMFVLFASFLITFFILIAPRIKNRTTPSYSKRLGGMALFNIEETSNTIEDIISAYVDIEEKILDENNDNNSDNNDNNNVLAMEDIVAAYVHEEEEQQQQNEDNKIIKLPPVIEQNLADINDKYNELNGDIPFFFHVPLTGHIVQSILSSCYNLVQASNFFTHDNNDNMSSLFYDEPLKVISSSSSSSNTNPTKYVNVNTDSEEDIERAKRLNLVESNLADVIISPQLLSSSSLFTNSNHKGRMFTLLRHPIERAYHMYYVKRNRNQELSNMTIKEYSTSMHMENNWLTRFLSGKKTGKLTENDLEIAKEVLERKCLVGLVDSIDESINRIIDYFNFKSYRDNVQQCNENIINDALENNYFGSGSSAIVENSDDWNALLTRNAYDMKVYNFAIQLFEEQGVMIQGGVI